MRRDRTFEGVWYAQSLLRELVLIYPTAAIMMQHQGIPAVSLSVLFMIWSGASVLLEVPTGVLADRVSRRNLLVLSGAVKGFAFVIWWLAPVFWGFAAGFIVWSLGSALRSGTAEAFLHDTLAYQGRLADFERIYGWGHAVGTAGVAAALLLGGWMAEGGYQWPLLLSVAAPWAASLLIFVGLREPPRSAPAQAGSFLGTLRDGLDEVRGRRLAGLVVAMIALLPTVYDVLEEYVGPLLDELDFSLTGVGLAYGLAFVIRAVSMAGAYRLGVPSLSRLCALFVAGGVVLSVGAAAGGITAVFGLCGYFALSGIADVLLRSRLQRFIRGHARATITSFAGLLQEVFSLVLYLGIGMAAQGFGWQPAVAGAGLWLMLCAALFLGYAQAVSRSRTTSAT